MGEEVVFVDTGYLVAQELDTDPYHEAARRHWRARAARPAARPAAGPPLVTTSYVFDEVVTLFNARGHHGKAVEVGERLLSSPSVELVHVGEDLLLRAFEYLKRHQDKRYSLTDCVSFVLMGERGISVAYAFDDHFVRAGFVTEPREEGNSRGGSS